MPSSSCQKYSGAEDELDKVRWKAFTIWFRRIGELSMSSKDERRSGNMCQMSRYQCEMVSKVFPNDDVVKMVHYPGDKIKLLNHRKSWKSEKITRSGQNQCPYRVTAGLSAGHIVPVQSSNPAAMMDTMSDGEMKNDREKRASKIHHQQVYAWCVTGSASQACRLVGEYFGIGSRLGIHGRIHSKGESIS